MNADVAIDNLMMKNRISTLEKEVNALKENFTNTVTTELNKLKEMITDQQSEKSFTVAQVATKLGLQPSGVNFHIRKGNIKAFGKRCKKIKESELNRYIETLKK